MPAQRLQKILSTAGVASRRVAETLIAEGRIRVNGEVVAELGAKADPDADHIEVDGRRLHTAVPRRYVLLYKPVHYVTTRSDPQKRPTVLTLLGQMGQGLYPVGRLDFDSEGLLLLTNDGELADRLTHPRHEVPRTYEVRVFGVPSGETLRRLTAGVPLDGRRTAPARVRIIDTFEKSSGPQALLELVIHEGRNRQVRRMCQAVGMPVITLARTKIGSLSDKRLKPGMYRELRPGEVQQLRTDAGLAAASPTPVLRTSTAPTQGVRGGHAPTPTHIARTRGGQPRPKKTLRDVVREAARAARGPRKSAGPARKRPRPKR
ncbi:MAG: rRNA pseudouridine synthase [Acidobacteria bacterium]|nr:rRNA pseudouridine synthase [Acidobacteriota bacterium]